MIRCCGLIIHIRTTTGRAWGTGDENAAQVKRLISRDKKEFMGNSTDILDKYTTEFGDAAAPLSPPSVPDVAPSKYLAIVVQSTEASQ